MTGEGHTDLREQEDSNTWKVNIQGLAQFNFVSDSATLVS